jgi:hypothetical protein
MILPQPLRDLVHLLHNYHLPQAIILFNLFGDESEGGLS